jgi:hypothetical protein
MPVQQVEEVARANDPSRHQLREKADEQGVVDGSRTTCCAAVYIDYVRDTLKV